MTFQERNKTTLRQAIQALPSHEPGPLIWEAIAGELQAEEAGNEAYRLGLRQLPRYTPPPQIWDAISTDLSAGPAQTSTGNPLRKRRLRWAAVAASLLLMTALTGRLLSDRPATSVEMIYAEETQSEAPFRADWNEDDAAFDEVLRQYASNPLLNQQPGFRDLHDELEELNEAKNEIEQIMDQYGRDPDLIRQIAEIERERSEVLKKMVVLI